MAVEFNGEITGVSIKKVTKKERMEDGSMDETVQQVAKVTLEFDSEGVDINALKDMINGRYSTVTVKDPKF